MSVILRKMAELLIIKLWYDISRLPTGVPITLIGELFRFCLQVPSKMRYGRR